MRAMAASLAIRPSAWHTAEFGRLSLIAALAGRAVLGDDVACKWPNDLLREGAKVAGLLLEAVGDLVVVGLGAVGLASRWCDQLLARIERGPEEWGREEYRQACGTIGRAIRWHPDGAGIARDIDEEGRLVVETGSGLIRLSSGEVWEVR